MSSPDAASADCKKQRGQYFTRHPDVHTAMCALVAHRTGAALEPSAGAGHLAAALEATHPGLHVDAVELDPGHGRTCQAPITYTDFFTWSAGRENHYQVIFGNPPYVAWKDVEAATAVAAAGIKARYTGKTNLYHLFIDRCADLLADGGELVFIVPKEWLYTTSAGVLRTKLATGGALTHVVDCGEEKLFADASVPALLIFRWVKGARQGQVAYADGVAAAAAGAYTSRVLRADGHRWALLNGPLADATADWGRLTDQYAVRVGLVTGADRIFKLSADQAAHLEPDCVQWQVDTTGALVPFLNANHIACETDLPPQVRALLKPHEAALRARRIATFDDTNWWRYGAVRNSDHMGTDTPRFFARAKTRSPQPFFTVDGARYYTGGVLGIFARPNAAVTVPAAVALLNSPAYRPVLEAMFLTSGDKVSLQPSTLGDVPFPSCDADADAFCNRTRLPAAA